MTTIYPTSKKLLFYLNNIWTDLTSDVVSNISGDYGISGNQINNRVAGTGQLTFTLDNSEGNNYSLTGAYSPNNANCVSGWKKGIPVLFLIQF